MHDTYTDTSVHAIFQALILLMHVAYLVLGSLLLNLPRFLLLFFLVLTLKFEIFNYICQLYIQLLNQQYDLSRYWCIVFRGNFYD